MELVNPEFSRIATQPFSFPFFCPTTIGSRSRGGGLKDVYIYIAASPEGGWRRRRRRSSGLMKAATCIFVATVTSNFEYLWIS